jgi:hypothetical protein
MAFPPSPARPRWMRTRYPVEMDEFRRLVEEAQRPGPTGPEAIMDPTADDEDAQAAEALALLDPPEGEAIAAPEAAAPALTRSFDGIGQTAWVPADPAIAVGASHVLVAVNTDLAGYSKGGALLFRWPNMTTLFATRLIAGPRSHARRLRRRVVA